MSVQSTPSQDRHRVEDMSIEELRKEYVALKTIQFSQHCEEEMLNKRIEMLREESVRLQQSTEIEEEHVANQLLRRLNSAERDVKKYEQLIHEEEETIEELSRQISVIHDQQREVESQLGKHQEEHIMLQGKLLNRELKRSELGRELLDEWQRYLGVLVHHLAVVRNREEKEKEREGGGICLASPAMPAVPDEASSFPESAGAPGPASSVPVSSVPVSSVPVSSVPDSSDPILSSPLLTSCNSPAHPVVARLERRLRRLLAEHAQVRRGADAMRQQYTALSERLKRVQDTAFLEIAQAAKYRESLHDAQAKLLGFNPRKGVS
ncbi:unnamed protein product [Phytomonas sp. EM1]|nr:unnamed protein product [Phytomonas sp. EM1]|eukprot:CCW60636.1 unnamed protein product [Phytomonas sp. isolate EM1]